MVQFTLTALNESFPINAFALILHNYCINIAPNTKEKKHQFHKEQRFNLSRLTIKSIGDILNRDSPAVNLQIETCHST